jgi:type III secretion system low calcium response chaperone LcrH/SycD
MSDATTEEPAEEDVQAMADRMEEIALAFLSGDSDLAKIEGITDAQLEAAYAVAFNLYKSEQFGDARELFRFLCMHRHRDPRFWMGLGATEQLAGNLQEALHAYALCAMLDETDPQPSLRAGECFRQQGNTDGALKALEACIAIADGDARHQIFIDRAQIILNAIQREGAAP